MVTDALADARQSPPAEDAFPLVDPPSGHRQRPRLRRGPEETDASALDGVLSSLSGAFQRARDRDVVLAGFAEIDVATLYLGQLHRPAPLARPADRRGQPGRADADGSGSAWVGVPSIDPSFDEMEQEIWRRLDWAKNQIALEAGRYEVILPPSGVGDMMAMIDFDALGGQDTEDGRTVFSKEGGGTRVGETITPLPFTLYSDPYEAGLECTPFVATGASSSEVSVFDNGLPSQRTDWLRDGVLTHLRYHRAGAAKSKARHGALHRQPGPPLRRPRRRLDRRHGGAHRARACCSPACGTSARSIRPRC